MAGRFLTPLRCELVGENPDKWRLLAPLAYETATGETIAAPADFVTDFASVPRWPLVYWIMGGLAKKPAVIHDYLYTPPEKFARARADAIFREAAGVAGVAGWRRGLAWVAVRIGGAGRFQQGAPA